jgi:arsenite methyltransferase
MLVDVTNYLEHSNDFNHPDLASAVDELSLWSSRFGHLLLDNLEIRKGISLLDIGCANGFPLFELAHVFGNSSHLTGIDVWSAALKRARFKLGFYALANVSLVEADAARQPFHNAAFDFIVSNLGINNWANPQAVLTECLRIAKPAASLLLTTNLVGHYKEFYEVFRETLLEMKLSAHLAKLETQNAHRGTRESLSGLLEQAGWNLIKLIEDNFEMRFADGSALLNHSLTKIGFLGGWRSVVEPDEEREVFATIERKLNETARLKGELRMTVPMLYLEAKKPEED